MYYNCPTQSFIPCMFRLSCFKQTVNKIKDLIKTFHEVFVEFIWCHDSLNKSWFLKWISVIGCCFFLVLFCFFQFTFMSVDCMPYIMYSMTCRCNYSSLECMTHNTSRTLHTIYTRVTYGLTRSFLFPFSTRSTNVILKWFVVHSSVLPLLQLRIYLILEMEGV